MEFCAGGVRDLWGAFSGTGPDLGHDLAYFLSRKTVTAVLFPRYFLPFVVCQEGVDQLVIIIAFIPQISAASSVAAFILSAVTSLGPLTTYSYIWKY